MVMIKFQKVYEKLSQAFDGVPCDELGISDEVKEQVFVNCNTFCFLYSFSLIITMILQRLFYI